MVSFTNRDMKVMVGIGAGWTIVVFAVFFARTGEMASLQAHSQEPLGPLVTMLLSDGVCFKVAWHNSRTI